MIFVLIVLSISLLISILFIRSLYEKYDLIRKELDSVKSSVVREREKLDNLISIEPGDTGIIPNYGLMNTDKNRTPVEIRYSVTYEVEIIEVTKDKIKVRATDYTSTDIYPRDPKNRKSIIDFLQDKWVDKNSVELVMDTRKRRNIKLDELGI
jgi:hypothetical protein